MTCDSGVANCNPLSADNAKDFPNGYQCSSGNRMGYNCFGAFEDGILLIKA